MAARVWMLAIGTAGCYEAGSLNVDDAPPPADAAIDVPPDSLSLSGLIAHYPMDDLGAGNVTLDASGNGHTGSCVACPVLVQGQIGMGYGFDGTTRVEVESSMAFNTPAFTVAAWIEFTALPAPGNFTCPLNKLSSRRRPTSRATTSCVPATHR